MDLEFSVKLYDKSHGNIRGQQGMRSGEKSTSVETQLVKICV